MTKVTLEQTNLDGSRTTATIKCDRAQILLDVCELLEQALRGLGYHFKGHLEIVEDEE